MHFPKLHVAAGTFHAAKSGPIVLQAFLGTCVGVTLFDPEARVGGLAHLMLPEPAGGATTFHPEKYASFGLPLFLRALIDLGAAPERMLAVMAGGALVGPVTDQDLGLDIGGRTAEITRRILKQAGIGIQRSETGGFFTCRLSLDMQTGNSRIDPVGPEAEKADKVAPPPPKRESILRRIDRIQPIPQVALKIMRILSREDWDIRAVIAEVQKDQVIGAQVLRLCNSPMIAPPQPVASIDHALVLIGSANLQKFVITAALEGFFAQTRTGYSLCKGGLYYHSIGTAIIAENLARITGKASPSLAYSAGLLHDIGKVALDQYIGAALPFFYRSMQEEESQDSLEIERRLLGMDHTEAGRLLAERWKLPAEIAEVISGHHDVAARDFHQKPLVAIVALANGMMRHFNAGMQIGRLCASDVNTALFTLGLAGEGLASVVDRMPYAVFGANPERALIQSTDRRANARPVDPSPRDDTP